MPALPSAAADSELSFMVSARAREGDWESPLGARPRARPQDRQREGVDVVEWARPPHARAPAKCDSIKLWGREAGRQAGTFFGVETFHGQYFSLHS